MVHAASPFLLRSEVSEIETSLAALNAKGIGQGSFVSGSTRAVHGEGPDHADVVLVGEQGHRYPAGAAAAHCV